MLFMNSWVKQRPLLVKAGQKGRSRRQGATGGGFNEKAACSAKEYVCVCLCVVGDRSGFGCGAVRCWVRFCCCC